MQTPREAHPAADGVSRISVASLGRASRVPHISNHRVDNHTQDGFNSGEVGSAEAELEKLEPATQSSVKARKPARQIRSALKDRCFELSNIRINSFASGTTQLRLLGIIFLCGPGMFAGLTGLGGGGLSNPVPVNDSLIANYASSAIVGFFAGPICTRLGFRLSLMLGSIAFSFYSACLLIYQRSEADWLLVLGGVVLGILSSFEWTAQGTMMMSYPLPDEKGKHVSFNLTMFNLGASLGSLVRTLGLPTTPLYDDSHENLQIVFLQNLHTKSAVTNTGTYIAFILIMFVAVPVSFFIVTVENVTRSDDSPVTVLGSPTWTGVIQSLAHRLHSDPHVLALFPMFFVSNFYLPYVFNDINLATFNIRTRALNIILFYAAGIAGAYSAGYVLDTKRFRRTTRLRLGLGLLIILFSTIWTAAYFWQRPFTRPRTEAAGFQLIDCTQKAYIGPLFLFIGLGFVHFVFQNCIYWFMTTLADCSTTASRADFAGFFKSLQAVGTAVAWRLSNLELPFKTDLAIAWGLTVASVVVAVPVLISKVKDTSRVALVEDEPDRGENVNND